jgi:hypothetical protein
MEATRQYEVFAADQINAEMSGNRRLLDGNAGAHPAQNRMLANFAHELTPLMVGGIPHASTSS